MFDTKKGPDRGCHDLEELDKTQEVLDATNVHQPVQSTSKRRSESVAESHSRNNPIYFVPNSFNMQEESTSYTRLSNSPSQPSESGNIECPICRRTFPRRADRDRHFNTIHTNKGERPWECAVETCPADVKTWATATGLRKHNKKWHGPYTCENAGCLRAAPNGFSSAIELRQHTEQEHFNNVKVKEVMVEEYQLFSGNEIASISHTSKLTSNVISRDGSQQGNDKSNAPDLLQSSKMRHITGTSGESDQLDESYRVRNYDWQKFFRPGRVFSTLWTDSFSDKTNESELSSVSYVIFNQRVHSKIRRFVVVRLGDRCCTCLPVTTYNGQGYQKPGINLSEHGLIYCGNEKPAGVKGIEKHPLRVRLSRGAERLNNSYINYGRVYTVETNVKVKDVGELDSESRKYLRTYYNEVNTLPDEDYDAPGPARDPQARAVELAGVGGGLSSASFSIVPGSQASSSAPPVTVTSTSWGPATIEYSAIQIPYSTYVPYNPYGPTAISTGRCPPASTYDMHQTPSSSNYPSADGLFASSSSSYGSFNPHSSSNVTAFTSSYPSGVIFAASDPYAGSQLGERSIDLPTLEEARASMIRRDSVAGRSSRGRASDNKYWKRR